jgi:N4-gp56 family major capsid protein
MAFTDTTALADQVIAAYDRSAYFALRAGSIFDQFTTVKPGNVTSPGSSVSFLFYGDLTATTAILSETVDIDPVALSDSLVTVTPRERGNAVLTTLKVRTDSFAIGFDSNVANLISWNMVDSLETVCREAYEISGETTWVDSLSTDATVQATNIIQMNDIRENIADLRSSNVMPYMGNSFIVVLHPDVEYDLMAETTQNAWGQFVVNQPSGAGDWYAGEVGRAAGAIFASTPRALLNSNAGSSSETDVYTTYIMGDQAVAKAESIPPHIVRGPVTDTLMRFVPLGWYAYLGYGEFRDAALNRLHSASSIGDNGP